MSAIFKQKFGHVSQSLSSVEMTCRSGGEGSAGAEKPHGSLEEQETDLLEPGWQWDRGGDSDGTFLQTPALQGYSLQPH